MEPFCVDQIQTFAASCGFQNDSWKGDFNYWLCIFKSKYQKSKKTHFTIISCMNREYSDFFLSSPLFLTKE